MSIALTSFIPAHTPSTSQSLGTKHRESIPDGVGQRLGNATARGPSTAPPRRWLGQRVPLLISGGERASPFPQAQPGNRRVNSS